MFQWIKNQALRIKGIFVKDAAKATDPIEHGVLDNPTLWVVLGFAGLLVWLGHGILTEANFDRLYHLAVIYIVGHIVLKLAQMIINGLIKMKLIDKSFDDKELDPEETQAINAITISDK